MLAFMLTGNVKAQHRDNADSARSIREVVVVSNRISGSEVVPAQRLGGHELERLSQHSVADALRYFSGIQLKDYGGIGGIKTVNIRSMGSEHMGVFYDGIELGNAQNGQTDLGQLSLDNVEEISLYNGQKSAIFQPASDFGHAGSIYIRSRTPRFSQGHRTNIRGTVNIGSSDMYRLSAIWEQKLSDNVSSSISMAGLTSSGRYKFHYRRKAQDGTVAWDTTATRHNGDIRAFRTEANIFGQMADGSWQVKGYLYNSRRGIPGAIVNNVWRRGERQRDLNTFVQGQAERKFGRFSTRAMAKYAYYRTHYINRDSTTLPVDNRYYQQEAYFSTANMVELLPAWTVSVSYDLRWQKLNASTFRFAWPVRWNHLVSLATAIDLSRMKMQASILSTSVNDHTKTAGNHSQHTFTPALFMSFMPWGTAGPSVRAYAKKSFRMPTFNDLYYTDMGNANLQPEKALEYDLGATWSRDWEGVLKSLRVQADVYYNSIHDKIIAYPKGQQFRWTMLNLGRVHTHGADAQASITLQPVRDLTTTLRLQYTYTDARDRTSKADSYYGDQIPYTPWHSGSAVVSASWRSLDIDYSFIYTGKRYNEQENIAYNYMQPWYTHDVSVAWHGRVKRDTAIRLQLEVNNLFSQDYDVILNYPMPGRNYRLSLTIIR